MKIWIQRRLPVLVLCLALLTGLFPGTACAAPAWPSDVTVSAQSAILMDANSGAILYEKNIHDHLYPASITKILTALIVLENCQLNEIVTFSHSAVYDVEADSSNANLEAGDRMTVLDCLYAMMLKSANEVANALAEHVAGSNKAFADIMNAKAVSLGCTDSHFNNPSGLNDPEHYTSAHDMALIARAAFQNEVFARIDSTLYYDLPPTKREPEGQRIYPGHRMMRSSTPQYYPGVIGGKTGYTSLAGNTLVTCALRNQLRLICVVLNSPQTHYADTRDLLDFGFQNFRSVNISNLDTTYSSIENDMSIAGLPTTDLSVLHVQENCRITLPSNVEFADVTSTISYDLPPGAPADAIARITYFFDNHSIGSTYLIVNEEGANATQPAVEISTAAKESAGDGSPDGTGSEGLAGDFSSSDPFGNDPLGNSRSRSEIPETSPALPDEEGQPAGGTETDSSLPRIPAILWAVPVLILLAALGYGFLRLRRRNARREEADRLIRQKRRQERLQDMGISTEEFNQLLQEKRNRDDSQEP